MSWCGLSCCQRWPTSLTWTICDSATMYCFVLLLYCFSTASVLLFTARVVDELVRSGLLSALANLADLDMGEVSCQLMPLKDEIVMVLVREEEIGELCLLVLH